MTLIRCITAYTALLALSEQAVPYDTALAIVLLKKRLAAHTEFYAAKEWELIETYGKRDDNGKIVTDGPGRFVLDPEKDIAEYDRLKRELASTEVPEEFEPVKVSCPDKISPAHIEALEGFMEFKEK